MGTSVAANPANQPPLCVDLDGTVLRGDSLHESLVRILLRAPWKLIGCLLALSNGRAAFKRKVSETLALDVSTLPYNDEFVRFLKNEYARGRKIVLVSAADESIVKPVSQYLGCFSETMGSDGVVNLKGEIKAKLLVDRYGKDGFDYAGDSACDLAVWREARKAIVVGPYCYSPGKNGVGAQEVQTFPYRVNSPAAVLRAARIYQWVKNILIFVPLVMAHRLFELSQLETALLGFVSFGLCASGFYLVNDLFDLEADRKHRLKRLRPLASGAVSLPLGLALVPLFVGGAFALASFLPFKFQAVLALYLVVTWSYSWFLKRIVVADIVVLAMLYALRVLAGGFAVQVIVSQWLLAFSMFFFLSLACVKRYSELRMIRDERSESTRRRGYLTSDLDQVSQFGSASGYISVLVLALYVSSHEVSELYSRPELIWLICPVLLYWISRIWILAARSRVHDDPIVFALKDRVSYLVGALSAAILLCSV